MYILYQKFEGLGPKKITDEQYKALGHSAQVTYFYVADQVKVPKAQPKTPVIKVSGSL